MYSIAICDDNSNHIYTLKQQIIDSTDFSFENITAFTSSKDLLLELSNSLHKYHIIILDIDLGQGKETGIDVAQKINRIFPEPKIIFISAYSSYMLKAYNAEHIFFIEKPIDTVILKNALSKAISSFQKRMITIKSINHTESILCQNIIYIERINRFSYIHTQNKIINTRTSLNDLMNILPKSIFISSHRSFIVNLSRIKSFYKDKFILDNNALVPISRNLYKQIKTAFLLYWGGRI